MTSGSSSEFSYAGPWFFCVKVEVWVKFPMGWVLIHLFIFLFSELKPESSFEPNLAYFSRPLIFQLRDLNVEQSISEKEFPDSIFYPKNSTGCPIVGCRVDRTRTDTSHPELGSWHLSRMEKLGRDRPSVASRYQRDAPVLASPLSGTCEPVSGSRASRQSSMIWTDC